MNIIIKESKLNILLTELFNNNLSNQVINQKVERNSQLLGNFLKQYGLLMTNIENGKDYLVYELNTLTNMIGKRYGMVQLMKDGEPYQSIYIKPLDLYKRKIV
jgi:hypothetical protein